MNFAHPQGRGTPFRGTPRGCQAELRPKRSGALVLPREPRQFTEGKRRAELMAASREGDQGCPIKDRVWRATHLQPSEETPKPGRAPEKPKGRWESLQTASACSSFFVVPLSHWRGPAQAARKAQHDAAAPPQLRGRQRKVGRGFSEDHPRGPSLSYWPVPKAHLGR